MKLITGSCLLALFLTGCAIQYDLMKAHAVSMKHYHLPDNAKLVKVADVNSKYCIKDFKVSNGKSIGILDEAIKAAEKEYDIDFITNAIFRAQGKCVIVIGDGVRISKEQSL